MKKNNITANMKELESIVEDISKHSDDLDLTMDLYKKGLDLAKKCYQDLEKVELEVKELVSQGEDLIKKDFER